LWNVTKISPAFKKTIMETELFKYEYSIFKNE